VVRLDRPPRPPAGAVTARVRRSILLAAERLGITGNVLLGLHCDAEHIGSPIDLLEDVEESYNLPPHSLAAKVTALMREATGFSYSPREREQSLADNAAPFILLALPDTEFLTVLQNAAAVGYPSHLTEELFKAADGALQAHGAPYRRHPEAWRFEWVGDPAQRALTVEPALLALTDSRLGGPRGEFEESLRKRRLGAAKDLEDAIDEAAKAVESTLQVLHDEHGVTPPRSQQVTPLFNSLVTANKLPGYVDKLIAAASGPRNNMASHGQGATVREVPEELADASIAAAATAITFLAHYLP
jgi:hypothetical protein